LGKYHIIQKKIRPLRGVGIALNGNLFDQQEEHTRPTFGEKLAFVAVVITTIGDILATVSAGILIEEGIEEAQKDDQEKQEQDQLLIKMQNQIDSLQREIQLMKKNNL
jgi:hypothetical protein